MAGRSAELLIFGEVTTGAGNDIQRATALARKMVQEWGMSDKLGPLYYGEENEEIFLGRAISRPKDRSEETAELIDGEVKSLIKACEQEVDQMLKDNIEGLKNLAETLLEYEILSGSEIDLAIDGKPLHREPGEPELLTMVEEKDKEPDIESVAAELEENNEAAVADGAAEVDTPDGAEEGESGESAESEESADEPEETDPDREDGYLKL